MTSPENLGQQFGDHVEHERMLDEIRSQDPLRHQAMWGGTPWEHEKYAHGNFITVYRGVPSHSVREKAGYHWTTSKAVAHRFAQFGDVHQEPMSNSEAWYGEQGYLEGKHWLNTAKGTVIKGLVHESDIHKFTDPGAAQEFRLRGAYHPDNGDHQNELKKEQEVLVKRGAPILALGETKLSFNPGKANAKPGYEQSNLEAQRTKHVPLARKFYRA